MNRHQICFCAAVVVTDDQVIEGVVICDDKSGNYYQQIAIQDATGGILLRLGSANLYNYYPVGRKLFVKLKGLYLGQYNGTLQLGAGIDSAYISQGGVTLLAFNLFDRHIIKGPLNQPITPTVVTASQLTTSLQDRYVSTLIRMEDMEFAVTDTGEIELFKPVQHQVPIESRFVQATIPILLTQKCLQEMVQ
ncbi:MAG: hypothetical protein EBU80_10615 [Chitinophagia bacterium]|nr:hypothetical protein [Chitinophagia bacterium]